MSFTITLFRTLCALLQFWKSIEYQFLRPFRPLIKRIVISKFKENGIEVNGTQPWDLQVYNEDFYVRLANDPRLGLTESYIEKWIDCPDFTTFLVKCFSGKGMVKLFRFNMADLMGWFNLEKAYSRDLTTLAKHYNYGNDLFVQSFSGDPYLNYSSGYWKGTEDVGEAQVAKMNLIGDKLGLKSGMRVLDIGSGWGGIAKYLSTKYGVKIIGYTISKEQLEFSRTFCKDCPLVEFRLGDFRDIARSTEKYDRAYSIEMIEHVGPKNYREYFGIVERALVGDGSFLLQANVVNDLRVPRYDAFFQKYSVSFLCPPYYLELMKAVESKFLVEDIQDFGDALLRSSQVAIRNLEKSYLREDSTKISDKEKRVWFLYTHIIEMTVRIRTSQVWQILLVKKPVPE